MSRESARKPAATRARKPAAGTEPQVSTVRYEIARDPEPEINIVNLCDTEYVLLKAVRELGAGKIEVVVQDSRIVEITRSQRVPVEVAGESWT
ncbi:DUF2292 domain-containing protein [Lysobacter gummosus]|uniref:DUF2292 domain-containing protein n=1 Tax=Lysobacter gummosus TaxID=262324 RepID=A0ABY3XDZ5_9GAMM|nr:DUF2292 domain-containing protein [Lysobacter gummosus]ALN94005.1 hypothetical protein LG3211_5072 [Lysobacter gummosus]UNP29442.1 DUF2292 domain-containing protein [Lysobacter gummosus]